MIEQNIYEQLTAEELRQLAKDVVGKMTDQGRAELLEWVNTEFPNLYK